MTRWHNCDQPTQQLDRSWKSHRTLLQTVELVEAAGGPDMQMKYFCDYIFWICSFNAYYSSSKQVAVQYTACRSYMLSLCKCDLILQHWSWGWWWHAGIIYNVSLKLCTLTSGTNLCYLRVLRLQQLHDVNISHLAALLYQVNWRRL